MNKRGFRSNWVLVEQTAGPSAALRSGRDDKFIAPERLNCRSLGFARDDKGEGGTSIGCDGSNDNLTDLVHSSLNLPQASQFAPNDTGRGDDGFSAAPPALVSSFDRFPSPSGLG